MKDACISDKDNESMGPGRGRRGKVSHFLFKHQYLQNKWSYSAEILHLYSL